jgi:NAD(P)-dependent dehydrogenase (short-subunit alcohol dehydrogenase family)
VTSSDTFPAHGRNVLIVGVGQNMGLASAERLLTDGDRVLISDLRGEVADAAATTLKERLATEQIERLRTAAADVRAAADCAALVDRTVTEFGSVDVLISCVGRSSFGLTVEMDEALFQQELQTNVVGNFLIAQAAARRMIEQGTGGRIVLFGSGAGASARRGGVSHCSSKAAVNMLAKVLALELGPHGITVNVVSPGLVPKPNQTSSQEYREAVKRSIPLGRLGQASDVAGAVAFLVSPDASWITGEVIQVNGGSLIGRFALPVSVESPRSSF